MGVSTRSTGQVAAAGRETWHARSTDGNRVRKRSEHAAAVSTMALRIAVSRDDCWLSSGSPQAACASSAPALEDAVAMPAVYGPADAIWPVRSQDFVRDGSFTASDDDRGSSFMR